MRFSIFTFSLVLLILTQISTSSSHLAIDVETGVVATGYNDVRIPGDEGTFISFKDDLSPDPAFFYRLRLDYRIGIGHNVSVLYAPLEINSNGSVDKDIVFEGKTFPANSDIEALYKFNSYRITYRYDFIKNPTVELGVGFTAKIRDAKISLTSPEMDSEKTNVGFVPIVNFRLLWNFHEQFGLLLYGDALAAPQGRAEDVLLATTYKFSDNIMIRAGYRILEGGADNDEVYNFALIHYASAGVTYTF